MVQEQIKTGGSTALAFILSIVLIYLICPDCMKVSLCLPAIVSVPTTLVGYWPEYNRIDNNIFAGCHADSYRPDSEELYFDCRVCMQLRKKGIPLPRLLCWLQNPGCVLATMTSLTAFLKEPYDVCDGNVGTETLWLVWQWLPDFSSELYWGIARSALVCRIHEYKWSQGRKGTKYKGRASWYRWQRKCVNV